MSKIINLKEIKDKKIKKKYFIYFLFIVILIYILYSIYLIIKTPTDTLVVENGVISFEESGVGYIIREEQVIKGENYKNGLTPIVSEGERAAKGQTIFRYNNNNEEEITAEISEINLKIQDALSKEPKILPTDVKNLEKQIDENIKQLSILTDIHTISEYKKQIEEIINKKAKISGELSQSGSYIKELTEQKEELERRLEEESEYINSPVSGVVSYRVDGLEEVLTPADFSNLTESSLENLDLKTGKIVSTSYEAGKVINNFDCYLCAILNSEVAKKAEIEKKVTITLSNGNEIDSKIIYINVLENGKTLIVFDLNTLTQELINYRKISFSITWWSEHGLKVPNSAIIEDEQGLKYVLRRKNGEDKKALVKLLKTNDKYSIISTYNAEELKALGMDVKDYIKISQYDTILLYPDINKIEK